MVAAHTGQEKEVTAVAAGTESTFRPGMGDKVDDVEDDAFRALLPGNNGASLPDILKVRLRPCGMSLVLMPLLLFPTSWVEYRHRNRAVKNRSL